MALKAPNWAKNAVPTRKGWTDPVTGEVLVSIRFTERQITEFNLLKAEKAVSAPAPKREKKEEVEVTTELLTEVPTNEDVNMLREVPNLDEDLTHMTKKQLLEKAAELGVDVSSNDTKAEITAAIEAK